MNIMKAFFKATTCGIASTALLAASGHTIDDPENCLKTTILLGLSYIFGKYAGRALVSKSCTELKISDLRPRR